MNSRKVPTEKISIVMPVKDTAPYLASCLDSIIGQTFTSWELIAVNDNSSDNSLAILEKYATIDERIVIYSNPNPGLLEALRFGYSKTSGELIHRMDSDDIMPEWKLKNMIEAWKKSGMSTVITGGTEYFTDSGVIRDGFKRYDSWLREVARLNSHALEMYKECVIPSNCWLVHRNDFDKIDGFNPSVFPEDYDLCFRFITAGYNIIGLDQVLHYWRDREDRISRNWECYKDNRFLELKINYFLSFNYNNNKQLVLWGAGKNGKDIAKLLIENKQDFIWLSNNPKKIGKDIYGKIMQDTNILDRVTDVQLIIAVASPSEQKEIKTHLEIMKEKSSLNYWFFS